MLSADIDLIELDGAHWARWQDLLAPRALGALRWALLFVADGRVLKAVEAGRGAVALDSIPWTGSSPTQLAALRAALGLGALVVLEAGVLADLHGEAERDLRGTDDYVAQGLAVWRALKRRVGRGVYVDPPVLDLVPAPSADALQRTFDLLIPDDTSLLAYLMEDDGSDVHTSIIAVKRAGDVALASTHQAIAATVPGPAFARDWRRRHTRVVRAVTERFARPSLAAFLDRAAFRRLITGPPDQIYRELAQKNLILDPAPAWLLGLIGGAAVTGMATRSARALMSFLPPGARKMASDLAQQAQDRLRDSPVSPFALLGFDPIALALWLRKALV